MDEMKVNFDSVLSEAQEKKSYNAWGLLKKCEYEEIVNRMKELEKPEVKKTQKNYRLLRKYDIMEISVEGTIVQKLVKQNVFVKHYDPGGSNILIEVKLQGQKSRSQMKGLIIRNLHVKYESPTTYGSRDIANVNVFEK